MEWHDVPESVALKHESELTIPRSLALVSAIRRDSDFTLVGLFRRPKSGNRAECIVVDVTTEGVPPKNPAGIKYKERIAIYVPKSRKGILDVRMLRKSFPVLMHQNQDNSVPGPSLCLYFDSPAAVFRTWTPQNFLRRIQWWLERSARNDLHPADQPVEQLFFASPYELVIPWNHQELLRDRELCLEIVPRVKRANGAVTFEVKAVNKKEELAIAAVHLQVSVPPVVHGTILRDPATLGELADSLQARGIDLLTPLESNISKCATEGGVAVGDDIEHAIVFLRVPISRTVDAPPEREVYRAYMFDCGALKLGTYLGAVFEHEGKYFDATGLLEKKVSPEWRSIQVMQMEVMQENNPAAARRQSGIADAGPSGVIVGVGALGSAILNMWGRSGWGKWTAIDQDHVKPHNLSRHTAIAMQVGIPKADAVANYHHAVTNGSSDVHAIFADACGIDCEPVASALRTATLVVDTSTTLEYPRLVSTAHGVGRHVSCFLTPNGMSTVMLMEDEMREVRLRTLEAQYYRAVISNEWGRTHIGDEGKTFWTGASCRDVTVVMPYSAVLASASLLAEQVPIAMAHPESRIKVWSRNPRDGTVSVQVIPCYRERQFKLGELSLYIDQGVERELQALRAEHAPNETGGILVGYYDFNVDSVVVVGGLPAPPDSLSSPAFFDRGISGLKSSVAEISRRTGEIVGYIGEWHSHPPGVSSRPSADDFMQLIHVALGMSDDGLPAVQVIVGESDLHVIQATAG